SSACTVPTPLEPSSRRTRTARGAPSPSSGMALSGGGFGTTAATFSFLPRFGAGGGTTVVPDGGPSGSDGGGDGGTFSSPCATPPPTRSQASAAAIRRASPAPVA